MCLAFLEFVAYRCFPSCLFSSSDLFLPLPFEVLHPSSFNPAALSFRLFRFPFYLFLFLARSLALFFSFYTHTQTRRTHSRGHVRTYTCQSLLPFTAFLSAPRPCLLRGLVDCQKMVMHRIPGVFVGARALWIYTKYIPSRTQRYSFYRDFSSRGRECNNTTHRPRNMYNIRS